MKNKNLVFTHGQLYYFMLLAYIFIFILFLYFYSNIDVYDKKIKNYFLTQSIQDLDQASNHVISKIINEDSNLVKSNLLKKDIKEKMKNTSLI